MKSLKADNRISVTLKGLAGHLGLAHSTVSRALNDSESISEETKERVRRAARSFGYVPNSGARLMRTGHSPVIGLLVPDITNEFYSSVARILAEECSERGRPLVLSVSEDDPQRELGLVQALLESRPAALVVTLTASPRKETLALLGGQRVIQFLRVNPRVQGVSMTIDDHLGGRLATEHLLTLGHTEIAFLGAPDNLSTGAGRLRGYRSAMRDNKVVIRAEWEKLRSPSAESGAEAFSELMALRRPPKAVFVSSPQLAVGVARVVQQTRIRIPTDLSLVAYGNSSWFSFFVGGLTTISLPLQELATTASSILFREVKRPVDESGAATCISLAPQLIKRASTAKLRV